MKEQESLYYNKVYDCGGLDKTYHKHYSQSRYIKIWNEALEIIKEIKNCNILDIGCGAGQFANLLFDNNIKSYVGIDFSKVAINLAKKTNAPYKEKFLLHNIYTSDVYKQEYNTVTILEVLEHLEKDIDVLEKIKPKSNVIFSVPNYGGKGHVRYFNNISEIINRYKGFVKIKEIFEYTMEGSNKIYLVNSIKI
ncbi:class I SAM-dependent methyltransferase [Clostridium oceanicum]|uniref:class I SAM-dependent methyltransferase n=1 Tax=Clostridium oceanicum TaxID=1543 RepID=UPI0031DB2396